MDDYHHGVRDEASLLLWLACTSVRELTENVLAHVRHSCVTVLSSDMPKKRRQSTLK